MQISSPSQAARLRSPAAPTVFVIDDDLSIREALISLLDSVDLRSEVFGSGEEFLRHTIPNVVSCLVLDVRLPGLSGLGIQAELAKANIRIPITFMTGYGDIPMAVRAMKAGAIGFLTKPFREQELLDAVVVALEYDRKQRAAQERVSELRSRFETLTPRELEVATWLAAGLMNKQIAAKMGIAEVTVKIHRMQVMRKFECQVRGGSGADGRQPRDFPHGT